MKRPNCGQSMLDESRGAKRIPSSSARGGCLRIAGNVKCFSETAVLLMAIPSAGFHRMPYIFTLLGIDEAGKVLRIIEKSLEVGSETCDSTEIVVKNWYSHWAKGPAAGEVGILAVKWLENAIVTKPSMLRPDGKPKDADFIKDYRDHLRHLKDNFSRERNSMIYIDYDEEAGEWSTPAPPAIAFVMLDAVLLGLFSDIVVNCMNEGVSFSALSREIQSIRGCRNLDDGLARVDRLAGTELTGVLREVSETDDGNS